MHTQKEESFALFRRAILDQDEAAWGEIHLRYRLLLISWARQSSVASLVNEQFEDLADQAFARAWNALTPARFAQFPNLAAILGYLRDCVGSMLIDLARSQATRERTIQQLEMPSPRTPEQLVLDAIDNTTLWDLVKAEITTPQEDVIVRRNIILGMPPRVILAEFPQLFRAIGDVYTCKRNLIGRLQRSPAIQRFLNALAEDQ
jgi:DNA-directed RNA polymerase specialized sigma24 family protein